MQKKLDRFRTEEGFSCIDIRVNNSLQLFDSRDPAPFIERDLDDDFVEYVFACIQSFSLKHKVKLVIYLAEHADRQNEEKLKSAIHSFFIYEAELQKKYLKSFYRSTYIFFLFGICLLLFCLIGSEIASRSSVHIIKTVVKEGLQLGGWVALWRPLDSLLYDWWPLYEKIRYYRKLSMIPIEFN